MFLIWSTNMNLFLIEIPITLQEYNWEMLNQGIKWKYQAPLINININFQLFSPFNSE